MDFARLSNPRVTSGILIFASLLVIVAFLLLARDTLTFFLKRGPAAGKETAAETSAVAPRPERKNIFHYQPVLSENVFGFPAGKLTDLSASGKAPAVQAPERVNVKVVGVVAWPGGFGYAFIQDGRNQEVVKTGDHMEGTGTVVEVNRDEIVIKSNGRDVKVPIEEVASPVSASAPEAPASEPAPPSAAHENGLARRTGENQYVVDEKAIEESLDNPKNIMTDARLLPRMVNGVQEGFTMQEVRPGGVYDNLGLKNGDILLSVNDFKLSNPQTALQAFSALRGMDRVKLDILRDGRPMSLTYNIR